MKVPCNIIEDLLPLYHDNVCSAESRAMVKEHLQTCEKCRTLLAMMDDNIEEAALVNDDRPIRAMKKAWDRTKKKSFRRGMRIGITVIAVIALLVLAVLFVPVSRHYGKTYTNVYYPDGTPADVTIQVDCWDLAYLTLRHRITGSVTVTDNQTGESHERLFEMEYSYDRGSNRTPILEDLKNFFAPTEAAWQHLYDYIPEWGTYSQYQYNGCLLYENYLDQILVMDEFAFEPNDIDGGGQIYLASADEDTTYDELLKTFYRHFFYDRNEIREYWGI